MRILQIEDDPLNAALFSAVLEPEGHIIVLEVTGPAGRARALAERFDLIALDVELPGLRGDVVCRGLRAAGITTPIIALTASAMPEQIAALRSAGFDECATKPIDPAGLRELVRRFAGAGPTS
jgi:CheY-like chemotaxis protein